MDLLILLIILVGIHYYVFIKMQKSMAFYTMPSIFLFITTITSETNIFRANIASLMIIGIIKLVSNQQKWGSFNKLIDKCILNPKPNDIKKLSHLIVSFVRRFELRGDVKQRLRNAYKTIRKNSEIPYEIRDELSRALILSGIIDSADRPPKRGKVEGSINNIYIHTAENALTEAKKTVEIAPNSCIFSCRKFSENITRYLLDYHRIPINEDATFKDQLHALQQAKVIATDKINILYHVKGLGNDAVHEEVYTAETAKNALDEALMIYHWLIETYSNVSA